MCKTNSFAQAAENCFITAQGISMSISRLEDELGLKLFKRTSKGVFPTKEGEYLLPRAEEIVNIIGDCETYFAQVSAGRKNVSVMFALGTVEKFAENPILIFKEKYPDITVLLHDGTDSDCENAVRNGEAELALCPGPVNSQKFDTTLVYSSKNVLVVNENNPLAKKKSIKISDLKNVPLALRHRTAKSTITLFTLCENEGFEPYVFTYTDDVKLAFYLAGLDQCCGVAGLPLAKKLNVPNLSLIPFESEEMDWKIYLLKKKDAKLSPEAKAFEKTLLQYCDRIKDV